MIFEYMDMSLATLLYEAQTPIPATKIKHIFRQIVQGVDHLHRNMVMHRDLKSSNILVDVSDGRTKVADLGLAMRFSLPFGKYDNQIGNFCLLAAQITNIV